MPIIDCHVHTWSWAGFKPTAARRDHWDRCLDWAEKLDVTYLTSCLRLSGDRIDSPNPTDLHTANAENERIVERSRGRALGLCFVNPRYTEASLAEMEEWIGRRGFVGLKLHVALHCDQPELDPLVAWCAAHRVPVCQHTWVKTTGNLPGESTPMMFRELAQRHPDAIMVMYHTGGDFVYGAKAARGVDNIYCDLAGTDAVDGSVEALVNAVGADRVVFGSDLPGRALTSQLAKVLGSALSDTDKEKILYGNMARILAARKDHGP